METRVHMPDSEPPSSITEVLVALKDQKLKPSHDKQDWGDWITFSGKQTVVSIESMRGLASSATIEFVEEDGYEMQDKIYRAFAKLGWMGSDEEGEFRLD